MFALGIIAIFFTFSQLIVAATNLIFKPVLRDNELIPEFLVSVLIPARNEERNIRNILTDLISQPYQNLEIIVFDDQSDDLTPKIVKEIAQTDQRIKLVRSDDLPDGWLGKNFACHSLSIHAKGDYLLFLDADVRIGNDIIRKTTVYAEKHSLGLLSIFPRQLLLTMGEKMTVPIMNYILLTLLPLPLVLWSGFASLAAANGQFMLFNAKKYRDFYPHEFLKKNKVEDIAISRYFKQKKIPVACLIGDKSIQCRMYGSFWEAVNGFSKNFTAFFGNSYFLATLFWLITTFGFIAVFFSFPDNIFTIYLVLLLMIRILVSLASQQQVMTNALYIIPHQLVIGLFIFSSFTSKYTHNYQWKGRNIT